MTDRVVQAGGLLIFPRLRVQNANAISGPLSWGFPSPTAFTGFAHALERRLRQVGKLDQGFGGVGIVCHAFEPQIFPPRGWTKTFCLTRNPVGKDGMPNGIVEEGRAHMEVTLVITVKDEPYGSETEDFIQAAAQVVQGMRLAGGSIMPIRDERRYAAYWEGLPDHLDGQLAAFRKLRRRLLPGFALVQREDLLRERLEELADPATALDALLDLTRLNMAPVVADPAKPEEVVWQAKKRPGWLVPMPIGYAGISPLYLPGEVKNVRDDATPFRFVESLYSLGQWLGPHRLTELQQLLWHTESDPDAGLYRCINHYAASVAADGVTA